MRLLIATIGVRDPESEQGPTGPLTLARQRRPQRVILLPSAGTLPQAKQTCQRIQRECAPVTVDIVLLQATNAASLKELMRTLPDQVRDAVDAARAASAEPLEIDVCATSGTNQMQWTLNLTAASGSLGAPVTFFQVVEPRFAVDGERVLPVNLAFLRQREALNRAMEHLRLGAFTACANELERLELSADEAGSANVQRAVLLAAFARALAALDNADSAAAELKLSAVRKQPVEESVRPQELSKQLSTMQRTLKRLLSVEKGRVLRIVDLYYRAERRSRQGAFADALNAVWILRELALSYRLAAAYGVNSQQPLTSASEALPRLQGLTALERQDWQRHFDAYTMRAVLAELGDAALRRLDDLRFDNMAGKGPPRPGAADLDRWLNDERNHHEHQGHPVTDIVARLALEYGSALIDTLIDARAERESYPLRPDAIDAVAAQLRPRL